VTNGDAQKTVVSTRRDMTGGSAPVRPLRVSWRSGDGERTRDFSGPVSIGRDESCEIRLADEGVSRVHANLYPAGGQWHVADVDSANGTFLDRVPIREAILPVKSTLQLGQDGPMLWLDLPGADAETSVDEIVEHYFGDTSEREVGHRTMMLRRAYRRVDKQQKRRYRGAIAGAVALLLMSVVVGVYQFRELQQSRQIAIDMFYNMKALQVQVEQVDDQSLRTELRAMEAQYDDYLDELGVLGPDLDEQDRVILRVARIFGECELNMPEDFVVEVKNYINKWRTTDRLKSSVRRLHEQNLGPMIAETMLQQHLPPQFLYLAMWESGFDPRSIGPRTRHGIPKGMWQFIPGTARHYGLRTGPLVELRRHDPKDERFEPELATDAAARYLHDIYYRDAQASGLLVMASYNWGPRNIRKRIRSMPQNPRDRNFWSLLKQHKIPAETYDYVLYIFSAIVIGEDPALFGFDFENPLEVIEPLTLVES
jgi:hypothetical protein